jgi:C-terminal processing protease CtpA/Prc
MKRSRSQALFALMVLLAGCGGGGGGGRAGTSPPPTGGGSTTPATCSLADRANWAFDQLKEWYLFPETLPTSLDPAGFTSLEDYVDALTANARSQGRDRFFTYVTSIAEENAFINQGASAGFGVQLGIDSAARRLFVIDAYEGAPALAAGIDRGTEILAIGTSSSNLQTVSALLASGDSGALSDALGPGTAGTTRVLRVSDAGGTRDVTVTKADFDIRPVSNRFGAQVIDDNGHKVGYVNLRTFISTADDQLRDAFASFRAQGITEVIVDLRYNGGGLISTAELFGDLLGGNRASSDVFDFVSFRPEKAAANNSTHFFTAQPQSVSPTRIAFIGTGGTASASELVINGMTPFLHANSALIGANTFGKPVGQIAIDRSQCDDRFRIIAFALENAAHNGQYFNGLAGSVEASCRADDDISHQMGDPAEASTRQALDFIEGRGTCTPITAATTQSLRATRRLEPVRPRRGNAAQYQVPGLF